LPVGEVKISGFTDVGLHLSEYGIGKPDREAE
jgi:hypothetical protein